MTRARGEIHRFADLLARTVAESQRSSISTFNDLPPEMLEEARMVRKRGGRFVVCEYLRFFVDRQDSGDAESFCEDVLERGADAVTWQVADCIVGVTERAREGIALTIERYVAALDGIAGERWFRLRWREGPPRELPFPGVGPGTLIQGMHYWTPFDVPNPHTPIRRLQIDPSFRFAERVHEGELEVEIRRWMATRAAWWARDYLMAEAPRATVEGILAAYPSPVTPSADGLVALRALVREARSGDPRWPGQVGHIGPDDWYRP